MRKRTKSRELALQILYQADLRKDDADALTQLHAKNEPAILQQDLNNSLHAADTTEEVEAQLHEAGLEGLKVEVVSDRHLIIFGNT